MGNRWKVPTNYIDWTGYYHRDMVETYKYINNVENFERQLTIKY